MITPNTLTLFRVVLAFICPFMLVWSRSFFYDCIVMVFFAAAGITDWLDGYLARKKGLITPIGKLLDPIADKVLILGLMISFVYLKLYHVEWILLIIARELIVTTTRMIRLRKGQIIPAESAGKLKLGVQISSVSLSLIYLSVLDSKTFLNGSWPLVILYWLHYKGILVANIFTVWSGIKFFTKLEES